MRSLVLLCIHPAYIEPEMCDLNRIVVPMIEAYWREVAFALRYKNHTVYSIQTKHSGDQKKCCKHLLEDWLTTNHGQNAGPKTWSTLLKALKEIEDLTAAREEILKLLQ